MNELNADLPEDRDGFRFRSGSTALDLIPTLQARRSETPRELLNSPEDLDRWLVSSGLASDKPGATEVDLKLARSLREAVFGVAASLEAESLDTEGCRALNRIAARPAAPPALATTGEVVLTGSVSALLAAVARNAVELFGSEAPRVRKCESPMCSIFFVDTSRSGKRRWCSMAACGNKAKVAALRGRKRADKALTRDA